MAASHFEQAITDKTRVLYCETIGNPGLEMTDIEAVAAIAVEHHLPLVVDSTFTPPCLFRLLEHGAPPMVFFSWKKADGVWPGVG